MKKQTMAIMALMVMGIVTTGLVSAFGGFNNPETLNALENNDFAAWQAAHQKDLTVEQFNKAKAR